MESNDEKTLTTIKATIGVNDLKGSYKASAKFMNLGPHFNVKIGIESVGFSFEVQKVWQC